MPDATTHPVQKLIAVASSHIGSGSHAWVQRVTGIGGLAWCAATMGAVFKEAGYLGTLAHTNWMAYGFGKDIVEQYGGQYLPAGSTPQVGDIAEFTGSHMTSAGKYSAGHVGMVYSVKDAQHYQCYEGNHGPECMLVDRTVSGTRWFARPNWTRVGGSWIVPGNVVSPTSSSTGNSSVASTSSSSTVYTMGGVIQGSFGTGGQLYETENNRYDASLREVGYWNESKNSWTKDKTNTRLCAINYTGMLSDFVRAFGLQMSAIGSAPVDSTTGGSTSVSGIQPSVAREIAEYLIGKGLNAAATCGVLANIRRESSFSLTAVSKDGNYSVGICQWTFGRKTKFLAAVPDYKTNLTGQLNFLWGELNSGYTSVLSAMRSVPNTEAGARQAADIWVRKFEMPGNINYESSLRQGWAAEYFKQMVITPVTTATASTSVSGSSGTKNNGTRPTSGRTISIPSSVRQSGIIPNYTSYTKYYPRWSRGTNQRKLADLWNTKRRTASRGIATINGNYLVAMSPIFGTCGDMCRINLEGGTSFTVVLGDSKGKDAGSQWGHILGGGVDIIEWESVVSQSELQANLQSWGIYHKKVSSVINYGSFFS